MDILARAKRMQVEAAAQDAAEGIVSGGSIVPALIAEIERLRAVLAEIRACTGEHGGAGKALKIINAALAEKP